MLAWQQQETGLQRQKRRAERALSDLEAEERARLTPIMEQLTPRLAQRTQEEETMKGASADWEAAARKLHPLEQSYQEQWTTYDSELKKLERRVSLKARTPGAAPTKISAGRASSISPRLKCLPS